MRNAPSIDVDLGPSRLAGVATTIAALATLALVLVLPMGPTLQAPLGAVVLAWAWSNLRALAWRTGGSGVVALRLGADRLVVVRHANGRIVAGHLRSATHVSALLTTVAWRPDGAWRTRAILVLPDMLPAEDFRRLRILLRYARSGVVEGAPASQA